MIVKAREVVGEARFPATLVCIGLVGQLVTLLVVAVPYIANAVSAALN